MHRENVGKSRQRVIDNPLKIVNPMLRDEDENLAAEDSDENEANEREIAVGSMAYYHQQEVESRRKRTRIVRFLVAEQLKKERAVQPERRQSVESIDLTVGDGVRWGKVNNVVVCCCVCVSVLEKTR